MSATALDRTVIPSETPSRSAGLALLRLATGAATAAVLARDLKSISAEVAGRIDDLVADLVALGLAEVSGNGSIAVTSEGHAIAAASVLGLKKAKTISGDWPMVHDGALVHRALGLEAAGGKAQKAVAKVDGLRLAIVTKAWGLKLRGKASASRARTALALVALERAFGNSVKGALGAKTDLSPKASRLLAAQLSKTPKDYGTDARLVAALAAEAVGVTKSDLASLRDGAIRKFLLDDVAPKRSERKKRAVTAVPASEIVPVDFVTPRVEAVVRGSTDVPAVVQSQVAPEPTPPVHLIAARPDPSQFAAAVLAVASICAEGWPGNRKAFVSHVWARVRAEHPHWQISEIEFKSMLTEAHRTGLVVLANADLKDKSRLPDLQASAIPYKNTVWHYVRVEG